MASGSLQAHPLAGTYDLKVTERATGVIQKVAFTNPHRALTIEINAGLIPERANREVYEEGNQTTQLRH